MGTLSGTLVHTSTRAAGCSSVISIPCVLDNVLAVPPQRLDECIAAGASALLWTGFGMIVFRQMYIVNGDFGRCYQGAALLS